MTIVVAVVPVRGETAASDSVVQPAPRRSGPRTGHSSSTATADAPSHDRTACALFRRSSTSKLSLPARAKARCQVEDVCGGTGWAMVRGSGSSQPSRGTTAGPGAACHHRWAVRCGLDGRVGPPPRTMTRNGHGGRRRRTQACVMQSIPRSRPRRTHRPTGLGDPGGCLSRRRSASASPTSVIATPLVARLLPGSRAGTEPGHIGAARLGPRAGSRRRPARGRDQPLALTVASVRRTRRPIPGDARDGRRCPTASWWRRLSCRTTGGRSRSSSSGHSGSPSSTSSRVATGCVSRRRLGDRGPATAGSRRSIRSKASRATPSASGTGSPTATWTTSSASTRPWSRPTRRSRAHRSCAVISEDQIPDWLAALPRQRSFSAGRRNHLLSRVRAAGRQRRGARRRGR